MSKVKDGITVHGFFRVHIVNPDGTLAGDSGWTKNVVTNIGFNNFLVEALGSITGSSYVKYAALGSGAAPATGDTALPSELGEAVRKSLTAATSNTSKTLRFTATFGSSDSFVTATRTLSNVGLYATNTGSQLFAGNTYNSSSCATNQQVNLTYDVVFS